ncbi:hypothetical protein ABT354_13520 [Streptomyces sp. NPDC000594]|uniref:hypothetical protein n=1 Tax=Streptomyces sp. NPDC000594 TaxID=3154261 RepID=UPI003317F9A0
MAVPAAEPGPLARTWLFRHEWGFNSSPGDSDILTYAKALLICARGDGVITREERDWVLGYIAAFSGDAPGLLEEIAAYPAEDDVVELVTGSEIVDHSRGALIFDALRACDADGALAPGEIERIKQAAGALGIGEDTVDRLRELYQEEKATRGARIALLYPGGSPN